MMVFAWTVACSDYFIAIPMLWIMVRVAPRLYELLVELERQWDRALEARRGRKLREVPHGFVASSARDLGRGLIDAQPTAD